LVPRGHLARYLLRRIAYGFLVIALVALTVFIVTRVIGDPARGILPQDASPKQVENVRHDLGLDQSIPAQLGDYVSSIATLDFGESYWQRDSVSTLIADRLPNTLLLVAAAITIAILIGIPLGIAAALRPGTWMDQLFATASLVGLSIPQFWLGALLIFFFAVTLGILPTSGIGGIDHLILPAVTLAVPSLGRIAQITRTTMIDELATPHILAVRAKGLSGRYLIMRHALRNVAVPVVTLCSWETAYALAGYSVVVETVFAWPGIGYLAIQAIQRQDLILVQGIVIVVAFMVVAINIVTDLIYTRIDPRIDLA
jgi:peptide/nickel transport system permease protein